MENLIREFNSQRKANKNQWVFFHGEIDGKPIAVKSFNTSIQVIKYRGYSKSGVSDCSVKDMNKCIVDFVESVNNQ